MTSGLAGFPHAAVAVAVAASVVLTTGTAVAAKDARERHQCSGREQAPFGSHSIVQRPDRFIGLHEAAARTLAKSDGYTSRVTCRDGRDLVGTLDLRGNRINFGVHHARVVGYWLG